MLLKRLKTLPMKAGSTVEANLRLPLFFVEIADGKTIKEAMNTTL